MSWDSISTPSLAMAARSSWIGACRPERLHLASSTFPRTSTSLAPARSSLATMVVPLICSHRTGRRDHFRKRAIETTTLSPTNPVTDNGTLAFLTFSTVGFSSGSWPLALDDTALGGTDHTDLVLQGNGLIVPTVIGGEIKIVPEPASVVLAVVGIIALLGSTGRVRRRHVA